MVRADITTTIHSTEQLPPPNSAMPSRWAIATSWATVLIGVTVPLAGVVAAAVLAWGYGLFGWVDLGLLVGMYVLAMLGITVGFHRLFTHRAFEAAKPVQFVLGVLGSMTFQGPLLEWVGRHRLHHQHSDRDGDPHSPHAPHRVGGSGAGSARSGTPTSAGRSRPTRPTSTATPRTCARAGCSARSAPVPAVGGPRVGDPGGDRVRPRRVAGGADRVLVGRVGAGVPRAPRDLERELGVPPVGHTTARQRGREPEQRGGRGAGPGRGVAQQPPRVPDVAPGSATGGGRSTPGTTSSACWRSSPRLERETRAGTIRLTNDRESFFGCSPERSR